MRGRTVLAAMTGAAYVAGSHWLMTRAPASDWNAVVVIGPMLAGLALFAARRGQRLLAAGAGVGLAVLVVLAATGGGLAPNRLFLAQHVVIHLALAVAFALTLRPGQEALITALARRVHGALSPGMDAYSRKVTVLWTAYFVTMAAVSVGFYLFLPFDAWAAFANLATPVAMVALFVGEYLVRYRIHPEFERATLRQAIGAYAGRHAAPAEDRR
jgi:uncharacterized membrane protein